MCLRPVGALQAKLLARSAFGVVVREGWWRMFATAAVAIALGRSVGRLSAQRRQALFWQMSVGCHALHIRSASVAVPTCWQFWPIPRGGGGGGEAAPCRPLSCQALVAAVFRRCRDGVPSRLRIACAPWFAWVGGPAPALGALGSLGRPMAEAAHLGELFCAWFKLVAAKAMRKRLVLHRACCAAVVGWRVRVPSAVGLSLPSGCRCIGAMAPETPSMKHAG